MELLGVFPDRRYPRAVAYSGDIRFSRAGPTRSMHGEFAQPNAATELYIQQNGSWPQIESDDSDENDQAFASG